MVQNASRDLYEWFNETVEDFQNWEKKSILRRIALIYEQEGPKIEKKIFKYLVKYAIGHIDAPKTIEGKPSHYDIYGPWEPLSPKYNERKTVDKRNRKFINTGSLRNYLLAATAESFYNKPKTVIDFVNNIVIYESMYRNGRKKFSAYDRKRKGNPIMQEQKIQMASEDDLVDRDGDNPLRPLINPMEDFLFYEKLDAIVNEKIQKFMEEEYENEKSIPAASKL